MVWFLYNGDIHHERAEAFYRHYFIEFHQTFHGDFTGKQLQQSFFLVKLQASSWIWQGFTEQLFKAEHLQTGNNWSYG